MNEESRLAGRLPTNNITVLNLAAAGDGERAEFRGGPIATARLLLDAYVHRSSVWDEIEAERPDIQAHEGDPDAPEAPDVGGLA
jgi:hypothetical protein